MRCLSPSEAEAIFGHNGFSVSLAHEWYRSALVLDNVHAVRQSRVSAEQPSNFSHIAHFIRALNRWLPSNQQRLFWVDHWETGVYGGFENALIAAAWRGLGESRTLEEARGLFLEAYDWGEEDQLIISPAQAEALGLLVGVATTLMMTHSDGWLVSSGCVDRIEFWEGHFFFHSDDKAQLKRADDIVEKYGCARWRTSD